MKVTVGTRVEEEVKNWFIDKAGETSTASRLICKVLTDYVKEQTSEQKQKV